MGQFFKNIFSSCLGVLLAAFVLIGIGGGVIGSMASSATKKAGKAKANSILEINFDKAIPEKTNNVAADPFSFEDDDLLGLHSVVNSIESAKENAKIEGIFMDLSGLSVGQASASVLRDALLDFKDSGKFILAYSKGYSPGAYYMASAADKVYVHPLGSVDFRGFSRSIPFFKNMLDKAGIKMQIFYAGQFKSATEPFRLTEMSDQNRTQTREYMEELYRIYLSDISSSRNISVSELRNMAGNLSIRNSEDAVQFKLVDEIAYRDEILAELRTKLGLKEKDKINTISLGNFAKHHAKKKDYSSKDKIAVIYAEGSIVDGEGEEGSIGGDKYAEIIRDIRMKDDIKAIVLRVNSGGGSALASDIMWRELKLFKESGRPVIASMGDVAASGGYYISCIADTILAEPNTITGSIGVFSMIPNLRKLMDEKLGISMDTVLTTENATGLSIYYEANATEAVAMQEMTDEIYEIFLKRVADGRGMSRDQVHEVAQGRVWAGTKAKEIGLVDVLGGLDDAIEIASARAGLDKYRLKEYPLVKSKMEQIIEKITGKDQAQAIFKKEMGELYVYYQQLKEIQSMKGVQARMPFIPEMK